MNATKVSCVSTKGKIHYLCVCVDIYIYISFFLPFYNLNAPKRILISLHIYLSSIGPLIHFLILGTKHPIKDNPDLYYWAEISRQYTQTFNITKLLPYSPAYRRPLF